MKPQLATEIPIKRVMRYVGDPDWALEQKLDGHRVLLSRDPDGRIYAAGRNGLPYGHDLPRGILKLAIPEGWAVDAELIHGVAWAFDVIPPSHPELPLSERRRLLERVVKLINSPSLQLIPQALTQDEKVRLVRRSIEKLHEGLVIKDLNAPYTEGRSLAWLKVKFVSTIDAVVIGVRDDGKESMTLGVHDAQLGLLDIGHCSILGKGEVDAGDVVEVRYLYAVDPANPRLVQPRMLTRRTDKAPIECTSDQLKYTNKNVMKELP